MYWFQVGEVNNLFLLSFVFWFDHDVIECSFCHCYFFYQSGLLLMLLMVILIISTQQNEQLNIFFHSIQNPNHSSLLVCVIKWPYNDTSIEFLGKTITDHDPIFFRNTSIKRGSWSGSFFQDPQKRDFTFCDCHFRSTTWVRIMLKTIRIMLKMIQNYQIYQNYVDSRKNDPDHDPLFILVFLKKIGSWTGSF